MEIMKASLRTVTCPALVRSSCPLTVHQIKMPLDIVLREIISQELHFSE